MMVQLTVALHHPCSPVGTYPARGGLPRSVLRPPLAMHRGAREQPGPCPVSPRVSRRAVVALLLVGCLGPWLVYTFCASGGGCQAAGGCLGQWRCRRRCCPRHVPCTCWGWSFAACRASTRLKGRCQNEGGVKQASVVCWGEMRLLKASLKAKISCFKGRASPPRSLSLLKIFQKRLSSLVSRLNKFSSAAISKWKSDRLRFLMK